MRRSSRLLPIIAIVLGAIVLTAPVATAQRAAGEPSGLTVVGYGEASAPAETATLQLTLSDANFGPPQLPIPGATPGARERETVAPVVAALVDAGIPEEEIEVIVGPYVGSVGSYAGPVVAIARFTLSDPSQQRIIELVDAAIVGAADENLIVGEVGVSYSVEDCAAVEREAREQAIADARQRAEVQAELLGVTLGDIIASSDAPIGLEPGFGFYGPVSSGSGCAPFPPSEAPFGSLFLSPFDPTAETEVHVYVQLELTFTLAGDGEATPSS